VYQIIKDAIENKKVVTAMYKGHYRKMCPHALGTKHGKEHALFYQFDGSSSKGLSYDARKNWRCMDIDELERVSSEPGAWHTAANHTRPSKCIDYIDAQVAY
jgi:hypothetical protein